MKPFGPLLLFPALALLAGCSRSPRSAAGSGTFPEAPVVLISIDTLRADHLPAYGYAGVATPAIDRLRQDSILFENAYSGCPLTLPSHSSLLTGLPPAVHGVRDNVGYRLDTTRTPTVADLLRRQGYATGAAVSAYVLRARTGLGAAFDDYDDGIEVLSDRTLGLLERKGDETAGRAAAWIDRQLDRHRSRPFFFFLHLYEPHSPYDPPEPWKSRYRDRPYDGEIAAADAIVGRFLDHLRETGVYDRAIVLLLADHGEGLGDHGEKEHGVLLYREVLRVPLLLKLPGRGRPPGVPDRVAAPVGLLDVVPTVTSLLGIAMPAGVAGVPGLPGRSLLATAMAKAASPAARRLYAETFYPRLHFGWSELRSLTDARYQYIEGPDPELYDLAKDPGERNNVLGEERRVFHDLKAELATQVGPFEAPQRIEREEAAKIAALGYLTATVRPAAGPLPDPKRALPALDEVSRAYNLAGRGEHAQAVEILSGLVERYPSMLDARFQLAGNLAALGRYDAALAQYDRAIELAPVAADGILVEKARVDLRLGRLAEAETYAKTVLDRLPAEGHDLFARVAWARGEVDRAAEEARQAVAADAVPRPDAVLFLAEIELHQGQLDAALALLDPFHAKVAAGHPAIPGLEFLRGDALARAGRAPEAEAAFRAEIRLYPRDTRAYASLAFLYGSLHRFSEIDPLLRAMAKADPRRETYLTAAATAERLGDREGAKAWRQRAAGKVGG
ncbi:MAG TPA: sulfatase-like hydrolase/transferase [Thermoanaerobaculia bacterium]|nr:sulfatase-like hydrolase/transferase [Thermoanaerobaculia bacterium]